MVSAKQARATAPGFEPRTVVITPQVRTIMLVRALPVIAAVRVATGSNQTLHTLPVAASVLDRAAVESAEATTGDALLRRLPGFDRTRSNSMFSNYGLLRVSFAGAGNDRGLVLADDIPAQDGFGGQVDWAAYPADDIERAELLLGAGSALYGAGAVGGVLDLQTFGPPALTGTAAAGSVAFTAGTQDYSRQSAGASAWITPRVGASVRVEQQRMQYWDLPPAYQSSIDAPAQSDASMASLRVRYRAGNSDAIEVGRRNAWDDQFEGRSNYTFARRLAQTDLRYTHSSSQGRLQATAFERTAFIVNIADRFPTQPGVLRYVQDVPTNENGGSVSWTVASGRSTFQIRADARHVRGEALQYGTGGAFQNAGSGSQNLAGAAVQETWRAARFEAIGGVRVDSVRSYGEQLLNAANGGVPAIIPPSRADARISPRVALRYSLSRMLALRASTGSGFRPPFLNELVRGYFIGNVAYQPNPQLVPERSRTQSAGLDYADANARLALDVFDTRVNDAIMFRTIDPSHELRSNVARTQTDGYTVSYTRAAGKCGRVAAWFTDQNARVSGGPAVLLAKRLQYVPQQSASVDYAAAWGSVGVGASLSYLGQTYADDLNTQPLGTSVLVGARVRIPLADGAAFTITAENLTGARYLSSIDRYGTPAMVALGLSLPVGNGNNDERAVRCTR